MQLILLPGPKLICRDSDQDASSRDACIETDVSEHASRYLFDTVALDPAFTLRDIFLLLDNDPILREVYQSHGVVELLAEVMRGPVVHYTNEYDPQGLEYLELYQEWHHDSQNEQLQAIHRLWFHGVGFQLHDDLLLDGNMKYRAGTRIKWSLSFKSPLEMLHLPVRLNPEVIIFEDNSDSSNYRKEIRRTFNPAVTLGQILDGVLWELSFYGAPESRDEMHDEIRNIASSVQSEGVLTHGVAIDLFADYKSTLQSCFADMAEHSPDELFDVLQEIGDQDIAQTALRNKLGPKLLLKPEFCSMTGLELRAYVRQNSEISL